MLQTIRQWLTRSSKTLPMLVFTQDLNRKRKKRLKTLKENCQCSVICVTLKKPKHLWLERLQWQPLAESFLLPTKLYSTARVLVEAQTAAIKKHLPEFFYNQELQVDYESAYRLNRQLALAKMGLPFLFRCIGNPSFQKHQSDAEMKSGSASLPVILDGPIAPALIPQDLLKEARIPNFTALFSPVKPLHPQANKSALQVPVFSKPTVLLVMSAPVHYELAKAAVESLENTYDVVVYFANSANIPAEQRQQLSQKYFTIDASALQPEEHLIQGASRYFNQRLQQVQNLPVSQSEHEALCAELDRLRDTTHIFNLLETLLIRIQPVAVLGCMEKNRMSAVFQALQNRYAFKLLNFQHGIMPQTHNMDWLRFDRFFVWNPLTRNVLLKDGYAWSDSLAVVGNPFWEQGTISNQSSFSDKGQEIITWRGSSPLLGAYTQHAGDYLTNEVRKNYLKSLFAYLETRPQVKLLIKKHPLETDLMAETMLAQTQLQDRVFICAGRELDLWESFQLIQLSTTICSTTLLDALKVNVPSVALDFTDIIADIGYGYDDAPGITIIRDPQVVTDALDSQLQLHSTEGSTDETDERLAELVYPGLGGTYAQRIREQLAQIGLLPVLVATP